VDAHQDYDLLAFFAPDAARALGVDAPLPPHRSGHHDSMVVESLCNKVLRLAASCAKHRASFWFMGFRPKHTRVPEHEKTVS
jgi:hypothetical protein